MCVLSRGWWPRWPWSAHRLGSKVDGRDIPANLRAVAANAWKQIHCRMPRLLKPLPSGYLTVRPCQIVACARWFSTKHWLFSGSMFAGSCQVWLQCHQRPFVPVRHSLMNGPRQPWFGLLEVSGVSMPRWLTRSWWFSSKMGHHGTPQVVAISMGTMMIYHDKLINLSYNECH